MDERELIAFLFRTLLEEEFSTKTSMAEALDIPFRTLEWVFQHLETAKGASMAYQRLIWYCCEQAIDLTELFRRFRCRRQGEGGVDMGDKLMRKMSEVGQGDAAGARLEKVYGAFDLLLRTVCETCVQRKDGGSQTECVVTRLVDALTEQRNSALAEKENRTMNRTDAHEKIGVVRWMLLKALNEHFGGNSVTMASALQLPEIDLKRALEIEQWRSTSAVFERLGAYCLENGISLDGLMSRYSK